MLITEGFAKTRWCPETRAVVHTSHTVLVGNVTSGERPDKVYDHTRCKGVECMMWRWSNQQDGNHRLGYCGKAGPAIL